MKYNLALLFNKKNNTEIFDFYSTIKNGLNVEFSLQKSSIPHVTIVKFESQKKLSEGKLENLLIGNDEQIFVDFSGIAVLPSRSSGGVWIELSILKNKQLVELQNKLTKELGDYEITSGVHDRFRPHVTLAKTKNKVVNFDDLDTSLLRKEKVPARLAIGKADSVFEFLNI